MRPWLLLLALAMPSAVRAEVILCLGDSITQGQPGMTGYPARLQQHTPRDQVVNRGRALETTQSAMERVGNELRRRKPAVVVLQYGTNDPFATPPLSTTQSLHNLQRMAEEAIRNGARRVYLLTPPPAVCKLPDCARLAPQIDADQERRRLGTLALSHAMALARWPSQVRIIELRDRWAIVDGGWWRLSSDDGLHPSGDGYQLMADTLAAALASDRR